MIGERETTREVIGRNGVGMRRAGGPHERPSLPSLPAVAAQRHAEPRCAIAAVTTRERGAHEYQQVPVSLRAYRRPQRDSRLRLVAPADTDGQRVSNEAHGILDGMCRDRGVLVANRDSLAKYASALFRNAFSCPKLFTWRSKRRSSFWSLDVRP